MAKPIRIYLDTSDYSRLLSPAAGSCHEKIKQCLIKWLDNGEIEIGVSYWIVTEFIKDGDLEFSDDRRAKGRLLKDLTRGNAFPHPIDLKTGATFPNESQWVPRDVFKRIRSWSPKEKLVEKIKNNPKLSRKSRRKFSSNSGFKEAIQTIGNIPKLTREDYAPFPVSDEFLKGNYLERYVFGKISNDDFYSAITKWLTDPEEYYDLWFSYAGKEDPLEKLNTNFHSKFSTIMSDLQNYRKNLKKSEKESKVLRRKYYETLRDFNLPENLKATPPPLPRVDNYSIDFSFQIGQQFSEFFPNGQTEYIDEYILAILDGRKPKKSDIIDLMHLQYIFYCDLIRCDKQNAKLFQNSNSLPNKRIVPTLEELPERISSLLSQCNS